MSEVSRRGLLPNVGYKSPVVAVSTVAITISAPPATYDGVAVGINDRILIKDQVDPTENGIYNYRAGGLLRAQDFNDQNDAVNGVQVLDTNSAFIYNAAFTGAWLPGTTSITWALSTAGALPITGGTLTGDLKIGSALPVFRLIETDATAGNQVWDFSVDAEQLRFRVGNDAENTFVNWLTVDRSSNTVDLVTIAAPLTVTGTFTHTGATVAMDDVTAFTVGINGNTYIDLSDDFLELQFTSGDNYSFGGNNFTLSTGTGGNANIAADELEFTNGAFTEGWKMDMTNSFGPLFVGANNPENNTVFAIGLGVRLDTTPRGYVAVTSGDTVGLKTAADEWAIEANNNAETVLFYNGSAVFETTATGFLSSGASTVDGDLTVSGFNLDVGAAGINASAASIDIISGNTGIPTLRFYQDSTFRAQIFHRQTDDTLVIEHNTDIEFRTFGANAGSISNAQDWAFEGIVNLRSSTTGKASMNMPHSTAPTSPANGDMWSTTTGVFARINGATVNLQAGSAPSPTDYTPALVVGGGGSSGTITLSTGFDTLSYWLDGDVVHVQGSLTVSSVSAPTGDLRLDLPFQAAIMTENAQLDATPVLLRALSSLADDWYWGIVVQNQSYLYIRTFTDTAIGDEIIAASSIHVSFSYVRA